MSWATRLSLIFVIAFFSVSCSNEETVSTPTPAAPRPITDEVTAHVRVVDGAGVPLAGMVPLVTLRPNAFDAPLASGAHTGVEGTGSVRFTSDEKVYLRAWDPSLKRFPNNYYDLLPGTGDVAEGLEVVMLDAATVHALVLTATGEPVVGEAVAMMLMHPTRGRWWPAEGRTDEAGVLVLPQLPPGKFLVQLETRSGGRLALPAVTMLPGQMADLGVVTLR